MTKRQRHRVAIVVDRNFGERLRELSRHCHVWACKTPDNLHVAVQLWAEKSGGYSFEAGVTIFNVSAEATPEAMCRDILWTVDLHHGEYSHDPPWSEIEVVGAALTPPLRAGLEDYGVEDFEERPDGFLAIRSIEEE